MLGHRFGTWINSFASGVSDFWPHLSGKPGLEQMIRPAAKVAGLTELDLSHPEHVVDHPVATGKMVRNCGLRGLGFGDALQHKPGLQARRVHQT